RAPGAGRIAVCRPAHQGRRGALVQGVADRRNRRRRVMASSVAKPGPSLPVQALVAVVAGGTQALSLAWPGSGEPLWWLQIASMALLAWLVRPNGSGGTTATSVSWRRGAVIGGLFATAWLAGTFWWLFISMHTYGGLAAPLAVAAVLGLAVFLASYYAVMLGLFCHLAPAN